MSAFTAGTAPQVRAAARRRLDQAADALAQRLLGFAFDGGVADPVALAAVRDALDRAGLSAKHAIEIGVDPAPWEQVLANLGGVAQISRDESRARRGLPPDPTPAIPAYEYVDAELVDPADPPCNAADGRTAPIPPDAPETPPARGSGPPSGPPKPPGRELQTLEDAVAQSKVRPQTRLPQLVGIFGASAARLCW